MNKHRCIYKLEMLIEIILFYLSRLYLISIPYSVQNNEYLWMQLFSILTSNILQFLYNFHFLWHSWLFFVYFQGQMVLDNFCQFSTVHLFCYYAHVPIVINKIRLEMSIKDFTIIAKLGTHHVIQARVHIHQSTKYRD